MRKIKKPSFFIVALSCFSVACLSTSLALGYRLTQADSATAVVASESGRPAAYEKSPISVETRGAPQQGSAQPKVTIVEFSDFRCPYCQEAQPTVQQLLDKYDGKVSHVFRSYPLAQMESVAEEPAAAALCAEDQGKFWEYHQRLFAIGGEGITLSKAVFSSIASELSLDEQAFEACLRSEKHRSQIEENKRDGKSYGVEGTPAFFINDVKVEGNLPVEEFESVIDQALAGQ